MAEYLITGMKTVQVSEDEWERQSVPAKCDDNLTVGAIFQWVAREGIDPRTIRVHVLKTEV